MNSRTLEEIIRALPSASGVWGGVFSRDQTPNQVSFPCAYIFNTHPHNREGEHWICVYIDSNGVGEYFDSFGFLLLLGEFSDF